MEFNKYELETSSLWSFHDRGNWLSHKGDYPGNWSPHVPRNIILRYTKENELILDQFAGSGTTLIEACTLGRKAIGCDINPNSIKLCAERLKGIPNNKNAKLLLANAKDLNNLSDNSIDLICTHPPYANIIKYSKNIKEDISLLDIDDYYISMKDVATECFRITKSEKYCAILIGDTRCNGYIVPLGFTVMNIFLKSGFNLKEIIIKQQHNCSSTNYWKSISIKRNFYLIAHEYLFIFKK